MKNTKSIRFSISELQVLAAMNGGKSLPGRGRSGEAGRYKRHNKAIENLKRTGVIYKDDKNILQVSPEFSHLVSLQLKAFRR